MRRGWGFRPEPSRAGALAEPALQRTDSIFSSRIQPSLRPGDQNRPTTTADGSAAFAYLASGAAVLASDRPAGTVRT